MFLKGYIRHFIQKELHSVLCHCRRNMPYKYRRTCPICGRPELLKLNNHLQQVHKIEERKQCLKMAVFTPLHHPYVRPEFTKALKPIGKKKQKVLNKSRTKLRNILMEVQYEDFKFRHKFSLLVVGPTQCGKTYLVQQILERDLMKYDKPSLGRKIYWFYGQDQNVYHEMKRKMGPVITFHKGLPDFEDDLSDLDPRKNNICVLDDLMDLAVDSSVIAKLFTQGRHKNTSVILMLQNAFPKGKHNTSISRNAQYIALFRSPADRRQIGMIADRVFDRNKPLFMNLYNRLTSQPYTYVLIDNKPDTPGDKQVIVDVFGNCRYFPGMDGGKKTVCETQKSVCETQITCLPTVIDDPLTDVLQMDNPNGPMVLNLTQTEFDTIYEDKFRFCNMSYNPDPQWKLWRVIQLKDYKPYGLVEYYPCVLKDSCKNITYWKLKQDYVFYNCEMCLRALLDYQTM